MLIIGGGVIGLSIACELRGRGVGYITIVERGEIGKEASFAAAGMLSPQVEADRPDDFFDLCCASRDLYPQFADNLLAETGMDVGLETSGTLSVAFSELDSTVLAQRLDWQTRANFDVRPMSRDETLKAEPGISPQILESLYFPDDWQVDNRKLVDALKQFAANAGIKMIENCEVTDLKAEGSRITGATTTNGDFDAGTVVLATGAWSSFIKIAESPAIANVRPIRGHMISFQGDRRFFGRVIQGPDGYIVPRTDGRILAGSTLEDIGFEKEVSDEAVADLKTMAAKLAPALGGMCISDKWAGFRPFADDGLPILGLLTGFDNCFVATAHYRNGILLAPITALIMTDLIVGARDSHFLSVFRANRFRQDGSAALG